MAATKRSQNKCNSCRYTWYPKGKDLSRECPNCKSKDVKIVGPGLGSILSGIGAIVVAILIFGGNKSSSDKTLPSSAPAEQSATSSVETTEQKIPTEPVQVSRQVNRVTPESQEIVRTVTPLAENERVVSEEELEQMKAESTARTQLMQACNTGKGASEIKACLEEECSRLEYGNLRECQGRN